MVSLKKFHDLMYNKHMKNYLKVFGVSILVASMCFPMNPHDAKAQECNWPGCYSGLSLPFVYSCTCDPYYNYMVFFPFNYLGKTIAAAMAVPLVTSYSIYETSPAQRQVGTFIPGAQGCYIYVVYGCYPLPVFGTVLPTTGVGIPGAYTP